MARPEIVVCPDPDALAARAAEIVIHSAQEAIGQAGRFTLVLSGGSTPEKTYRLLPSGPPQLDWSRAYLFMGDERFVPADDPRSNFAMVRRSLLNHVSVPADHVFPVPTTPEQETPADAARAYAAVLARFFAIPVNGPPPRFDLVLLGLGDDGHTASLFPGAEALKVRNAWVAWSPPGTLPPPVDRATFTFPVLNAARHVLFLVAGAKKAEPLRDVLEGHPSPSDRPAAGVQPAEGRVTWLVDEAAVSLLKRTK
jgi:6-phosphogluconolactonase